MPMERPCKDQVIIDAQFIETFCKIALKNEPASLINYDKSKYDPAYVREEHVVVGFNSSGIHSY